MDVLTRIKQLVLSGRVRFSEKARDELEADDLTVLDVVESIITAQRIDKTLRSRSEYRRSSREKLYVIKSLSYDGTPVYSKGKITREEGEEYFYILISAKIAWAG